MFIYVTRRTKETLLLELLKSGMSVKLACDLLAMKVPHAMYILRTKNLKSHDLKKMYNVKSPTKKTLSQALEMLLRYGATPEEVRILLGLKPSAVIGRGGEILDEELMEKGGQKLVV
ncbi:hypothetical protein [Desulfacinum hydrothermale]|uniref:hypothetical protein n=1 Tax=Desulfacinum hydrothermale TaxID=109258 RepID=UPI0009FC9A15|nr:hypothetical protein [Desulfacinum hydrothermale]